MRRILFFLTALGCLLVPANVFAVTADVLVTGDYPKLEVRDGAGTNNDISIALVTPGWVRVIDRGGSVTAGSYCTAIASDTVDCNIGSPGGPWRLTAYGGDGDDRIDITTAYADSAVADGGAGDDTLTAMEYGSVLKGMGGNDTLKVRYLDNYGSTYDLQGGDGIDRVDFTGSTPNLVGTINGELHSEGGIFRATFATTDVENLTGGGGDDHLRGNLYNNEIDGGFGTDVIEGGLGDDILTGGSGNDRIVPDGGTDRVIGNNGSDTVDYSDYYVPVFIDRTFSLSSGEVDTFASIENYTGTRFNDTIYGLEYSERIVGLAGNDRLWGSDGPQDIDGGPGDDTLLNSDNGDTFHGGDGTDTIDTDPRRDGMYIAGDDPTRKVTLDGVANDGYMGYSGAVVENDNVLPDVENIIGGEGEDVIVGSSANNRIEGSLGNDNITGGSGIDSLFGDDGDDRLNSLDSESDSTNCGNGVDTANADRSDAVEFCETTVLPPPDTTTTAVTTTAVTTMEKPKTVTVTGSGTPKLSVLLLSAKRGVAAAKVSCKSEAAACSLSLSFQLKPRKGKLSKVTKRFTIAAGKTQLVSVKLAPRVRRALKGKRGKAQVSIQPLGTTEGVGKKRTLNVRL